MMDAEDLAEKYGCNEYNDCWRECMEAAQDEIDSMKKDKDANDQETTVSDIRASTS